MGANLFDLTGKVAIVTGTSRGLGQSFARALARAGADLVLTSRRVGTLAEFQAEIEALGRKALALPLDVRDYGSIQEMVEKAAAHYGKIDILVNNAGCNVRKPALEVTWDDWNLVLDTNLRGTFFVAQAVARRMIARRHGRIINIGSVAGHTAYEGGAVYCAAKAGELQITRALRHELLGTGIRVGTVDPGLAETEFSLVRFKGDAAQAKKVYEGMNPLTAEDIAEILVWVARRPPHVNIDELIVKPVDQAEVGKVYRRKTG